MDTKIEWNKVYRGAAFLGLVFICILSVLFLYRSLLVPFCISMTLAYLLAPLVKKFDRLPKIFVICGLLSLTLALLALITIRVFPFLYKEIISVIKLIPRASENISAHWIPAVKEFLVSFNVISTSEFDSYISEFSVSQKLITNLNKSMLLLWNSVPQVLGTVMNLVLIPMMTFFLLKDYDLVFSFLKRAIPPDLKFSIKKVAINIDDTFRGVLKGQLTVAMILGSLYIVGLNSIGLHAASAIGLSAGLCRIIPYLDVIVGLSLSLLVIFSDFQNWGQVVSVGLIFLVVQILDGMFITPKILSKKAGLHPVVVIFSVIAFGDLFGFWGVLLAIPAVAVFKAVLVNLLPIYFASAIYKWD